MEERRRERELGRGGKEMRRGTRVSRGRGERVDVYIQGEEEVEG